MKIFAAVFAVILLPAWQIASSAPLPQVAVAGGVLNVEYTVGTGANLSLVLIDFADTGGSAYAFGYRWNTPTDFASVITSIANNGPSGKSLHADLAPPDPMFGTFVNNFSYLNNAGNPDDFWRVDVGTYSTSGLTWADSDFGISSLTTDNFSAAPTENSDMSAGTAGIIGFYNSFANDNPPATPTTILKPGDFNLDGHVDAGDIQAMEAALVDLNAYQQGNNSQNATLIAGQLMKIGNLNGDSQITNADLQFLLNSLKSGGGSTCVPEPATFTLTIGFAASLLLGRRRCKTAAAT